MTIRILILSDYDEVKNLVYQVHELHFKNRPDIYRDGNPLPLSYFEKIVNDKDSLNYVCIEENKIVGLITSYKINKKSTPIEQERTVRFIDDIIVDKNHRRNGIGKYLYNFLKEQSIIEKVDSIELNVWAFNKDAISFYESLGMTIKNMKMENVLKNQKV